MSGARLLSYEADLSVAPAMLFAELVQSPLASLAAHLLSGVALALAMSQPLARKHGMSPLLHNRECAYSQHQL